MTGLNSAVSAALSGLDAFSEGIGTVGNNIANEDTAGYATRSTDIQTASGDGVVDPALVQRAADSAQASGVYAATAASTGASTLASVLTAIDDAFTGTGDIDGTTSTFFADLTTLASDPTDAAQISTVLSDAQAMAGAFNGASGALTEQSSQIDTQLTQQVSSANSLLDQIASLNDQLRASPNDASLLDQQQAALTSLSSYLGVQTLPMGDSGAVAVMVGGSVLVDQSGAQSLAMSTDAEGETELTTGTDKMPLSTSAAGGSIGGLLAGASAVTDAGNQLDWIAGTVASLVNQSQSEGLDGTGSLGSALLATATPTTTASSANTGTASLGVTVTDATALPSSGAGYTISYSASGWSATVPGSGTSIALGTTSPLTLAGMSIAVTGTPAPGDSFTVAPEKGAAAALSVLSSDPTALAVADPYVLTAGSIASDGTVTDTNAGTITESADTVTDTPADGAAVIPASGYVFGDALTVKFTSASAYDVIDTTTGTTLSSGTFTNGSGEIAVPYPSDSAAAGSYWQVTLSGSPAAGDEAQLTSGGLNSGSNASRMADLWSQTDSSLPGGSLQGSVLALIGTTGAAAAQATTLSSTTASNLTTAQTNLSTVAGVDEDQQATLLTQYEQAYQAAAKVISTASTMFQSLLSAI